jgi:hypothetical protein
MLGTMAFTMTARRRMKTKLTAFAITLTALLGGGVVAGQLIDPSPPRAAAQEEEMTEMPTVMKVRGLAVADNGLRLVVATPDFTRGRTQQLRFRIVDDRGATVRDFDVEHTKRMHLIVVRRDLTGFQHLHPVQGKDGEWTTALRLDEAGSYRVFADFSHDEEPVTLASDLRVDGPTQLEPLAAPSQTARADGRYVVRMQSGEARAGEESAMRFSVSRDGKPVTVEPYLGANGHLVALREGDLAFLHVHPTEGIEFESTFPTTGRYGLFLQFKAGGRVHTAAFTKDVR